MSYGEKYKLTFEGLQSVITQVVLEQKDYAGASSDIMLDHIPIKTKHAGEGKDSLKQLVKGSASTVSIVSKDSTVLDLSEFLIVDDREYRVKLNSKVTHDVIYRGTYTISSLPSNALQYSYVDCLGDYSFDAYVRPTVENPLPCNNLRLHLYIGGILTAVYEPTETTLLSDIDSAPALHRLIEELEIADSSYVGVDTDGDNYKDRIQMPGVYSNTDTVEIYMESELCDGVNPTTETIILNSAFGGGDTGDTLQLFVNEDGTANQLASIIYAEQSKQEIISSCVAQINSEADYSAYQDPDNTDNIIVTCSASGVSEAYVLGTTSTGVWVVSSDGLNKDDTSQYKTVWIGFVLPAISKMNYTGGPQMLELEATDGLGDLKGFDYDFGDISISQMEVVSSILRETGLNLNIYSFADIFEDGMDSNTDPLNQTYINQEAVAGRPMKDVLEDIMKSNGCELLQSDGAWYIIPFDAYGIKTFYQYDFYGTFIQTDSEDLNINIGSKSDFEGDDSYGVNTETSAIKTVEAAHSLFDYRHDYGLKEQLFRDPTLSLFNLSSVLLFWDGDTDYQTDDDNILQFTADNKTISQIVSIVPYTFKIEYEYKGQAEFEIIIIGVDVGGNTQSYWYKQDTFSNFPRAYEVDSVDEYEVLEIEISMAGLSWTPEQTHVRIKGFTDTRIKRAELNPLDTENYVKGFRKEASYDIEGYREEPREETFLFGDLPAYTWAALRYLNGTVLSNRTLTSQWNTTGLLIELIADRFTRQLCQHRQVLVGDFIFKKFISPKSRFYDSFGDAYYRMKGGEFEYKQNLYSLELEEIKESGAKATITKEYVLYDGRPKGTSIYSTNRESFSAIGGGGGTPVDLSQYLTATQIIALINGVIDTFTGAEIDSSRQITLYHGRETDKVDVDLWKDNKLINKTNYQVELESDVDYVTLTILVPYTDTTTFIYRIK